MKLALYLPSLRGGGAERAMVTKANGFADRGLHVDLVLATANGPYLDEVGFRVRIVDMGTKRVASTLPGLIRYLRCERPDAMLSALDHANVIALLARDLARVHTRMVVTVRTTVSSFVKQGRPSRQRYVLLLMKLLYNRADAIVAVSSGVADDLALVLGLPRSRVRVVYNPVVTPALRDLASASVEHPWLVPEKLPLIIAVGRLTAAKDYPTLLKAFAKVRDKRDCRLIILGEGELRESLESLVDELGISESVQFPGFVDNPFAWMARASLFVLSSAWEGLPNVLIQAMACGLPVVSTDCPSGPYEILEGGKWGTLVPVGDVNALAAAIIKQIDHPSKEGVKKRSSFFSIENAIDGYLRAIRGDIG
jgi:glycosyltransferase involved in cell wall biosynthesis